MKAAIDAAAFQQFRDQALGTAGKFLEIESVVLKPGQDDPDVARYEFRTAFEEDDDDVLL